MTGDKARVALVTGANRGLGLETCRQLGGRGYRVVLTARGKDAAREAAGRLQVDHAELDVTDPASLERAAALVGDRYGKLDVLVNNAGVLLDGFDGQVARKTIDVNLAGAMSATDAFRPLLSSSASVVMVSSGLGELSCLGPALRERFLDPRLNRVRLLALVEEFALDVEEGTCKARGWPKSAYSVSKAALNAFARLQARELEGTGIRVNAVCPGWVRTGMGGPGATRGVRKGAGSIVWAATLEAGGPSGGFFRDGARIPW